jgi:hypothetical protein
MTYPTPEQIAHMVNTMSNADWTKLGSRLCTAIDRERRGGSAIPDGFPMRGGRSAPGPTQTGETGQDGEDHSRVDWTSVEAAGNARATARDEHHDRTVNAVGYLQQAVQSLCALVTHLDRIEARTVHVEGREPGCSHHAQHGLHEERYRGDLGRACYDFKATYGCLPPFKLLDDRERGIRWTTASIARALADVARR